MIFLHIWRIFVKKFVLSLSSLLLIALLSACGEVTITPINPLPVVNVGDSATKPSAIALGADNKTASGPFSLTDTDLTDNVGRNFFYQVDIPGDAGGDGIWFEIEGANGSDLTGIADIVLLSKDSNGNFQEIRRSTGPGSFGTIASFSSEALETSAIVPVPVDQATECRGPCIFVPYPANKTAGTNYTAVLAVRVLSKQSINYNLYTYAANYYDKTESTNNQCATLGIQSVNPQIDVLPNTPDYVGAIESVTDVDCFTSNDVTNQSVRGATITLPAATTIALRADFYIGASSTPFDSCIVSPSDRTCSVSRNALEMLVKVRPANQKAAPFVNAQYELSFTQ